MQGAATAAHEAPPNGSHQFSELSFRFYKCCEQDSQTCPKVVVGDTAASETLTSVGGYNFSCCPVFNTIRDSVQCTKCASLFSYN